MSTITGERIKKIRLSKGLSQEEFGVLIDGADKSLVSKWERGKCNPNLKRVLILSELGQMEVENFRSQQLSETDNLTEDEISTLNDEKGTCDWQESVDDVYVRLFANSKELINWMLFEDGMGTSFHLHVTLNLNPNKMAGFVTVADYVIHNHTQCVCLPTGRWVYVCE